MRNYWRLYIAMQFSRRGMSLWVGSPLSNSLFDPYALPKILWPLLKQPRFLFASFLWPWSFFTPEDIESSYETYDVHQEAGLLSNYRLQAVPPYEWF